MKKIVALAVTALLTVSSLFAQDGKSIYNKYSDQQGVSAVYISSAMFRLLGRIPDIDTGEGEVNLSAIIQSLRGMYVLNTENPQVAENMSADVRKFLEKGKFELLMEVKDEGELVRMYTIGKDELITGFALLAHEDSECTFICLDGNMDRAAFESIIKAAD